MSKRVSTAIKEFLKVWGLLTLVVIAGFVVTYQYVGAPPPKSVRIATGAKNGAYFSFAERYARSLSNDGIALEIVPTAGSVENFALLKKGEQHDIEKVGARLRSLMPWIQKRSIKGVQAAY